MFTYRNVLLSDIMAACWAGNILLKPCINAFLVKSMGAMTNDTHALILLNGILADGAIVVLGLNSGRENSTCLDLFRAGENMYTIV